MEKVFLNRQRWRCVLWTERCLQFLGEVNFQTILGNKEAFDKAGVEIPESWNYETFYGSM